MPLLRDDAVTLRRLDFSETSQILALMTRGHGQVRAIAKGVRRNTKTRFNPGIDLLEVGSVVLSVRGEHPTGLVTMTEWKQSRAMSGLRAALEPLHAGQYVAEVASALTQEWDPHPQLFDAIVETLRRLADGESALLALAEFQWRMLISIGSAPRMDACVACGRSASLTHFSAFEGGMVCRSCQPRLTEKRAVTERTWLSLRDHRFDPPLGPFNLLNYHISHLMGRAPLLAARLVPPTRPKAPQ